MATGSTVRSLGACERRQSHLTLNERLSESKDNVPQNKKSISSHARMSSPTPLADTTNPVPARRQSCPSANVPFWDLERSEAENDRSGQGRGPECRVGM